MRIQRKLFEKHELSADREHIDIICATNNNQKFKTREGLTGMIWKRAISTLHMSKFLLPLLSLRPYGPGM